MMIQHIIMVYVEFPIKVDLTGGLMRIGGTEMMDIRTLQQCSGAEMGG
jgi:hypothetical protein